MDHQDRESSGALQWPALQQIGEALRSELKVEAPPAYLGDRALTPELERQLVRLEAQVRARETGVHAVAAALDVEESEQDT